MGQIKGGFFLYLHNHNGDVISGKNKWFFSGFAREYIHEDRMGHFPLILELDEG